MKNKTLQRFLLPVGLLCITGISFIEHFIKLNVSDFSKGFLNGIGIAMMLLSIIFMQRYGKTVCKNNEL